MEPFPAASRPHRQGLGAEEFVCARRSRSLGRRTRRACGGRRRGLRPAHDDNWFALLEDGRLSQLICRQSGNELFHTARLRKVQRMPVNRDLSGADAQKAAEIDDDGLHHPAAIDDDIDDAAQILACCALHRLAEKGFGRIPVSNDGWRFRGCRGRRGGSPRLGEHAIRRSCEEGDLTVDYEGARGRHRDKPCTASCR